MSSIDLNYYENKDEKLSEIRELLKEIPLYTFYEKINKKLEYNEETHNCEACNTILSSTSSEEPQLLQLCKSFCNIILKDSELDLYSDDPYPNRSCIYMNLLLYNNVISITENFDIIEKFYTALQTISKIPRSGKKFCAIKNYKYNREDFKKKKYLNEFLLSYNVINEKISRKRNTEYKLYCNHIKENFRLYNDIKEKCTPKDKCTYNTEVEGIKKIFSDPKNLSEIYSKCNYVQTPCKQGSKEEKDVPCLTEKSSTLPPLIKDPEPDKFTPIGSWLYSKIKRTNNMEKNINAESYYISHHNTRIDEMDPGNSSNNTY
ncbi:hypothetical protein PVIIG_06327 [Plasmodium vivax India VII]|uniref:VIR protein n=1 Tax=Plasmodium vivax India VII TaxID=1077284 RepID=A0A0J9S2W1_PLAVI|nr:hypothetical protein PVIIG_06327 [Plasmodium vivax India VII]